MKLFVLFLAAALALPAAHSQLPAADSLHAALDTFLDRQLAAQLAEYDESKKGNWLYYLPSVGIGYTPIAKSGPDGDIRFNNAPRPTISFSLGQVLTARRRNSDIRAKRESLAASAALDREKAHRELDRLLLELETMRRVQEIDRQLFVLIQADYDAARISPQEFLPKQKAFLEGELAVMRKEMEVRILENEILIFSKFKR
jgi:hypothetical protein